MSAVWVAFIAGCMVGGSGGLVLAAALCAAGRADRAPEATADDHDGWDLGVGA